MATHDYNPCQCITQVCIMSVGEAGESVHTPMAEKSAADRSIREFGFNMVVSDKIAMDRTIPDTRFDE